MPLRAVLGATSPTSNALLCLGKLCDLEEAVAQMPASSTRGETYDLISCDLANMIGFCDAARRSGNIEENTSSIERNPSNIDKSKQHLEISGNEIIGVPPYNK